MQINQSPEESNYNSVFSRGGTFNEMFLICFLMTPR